MSVYKTAFVERRQVSELTFLVEGNEKTSLYINPTAIAYCVFDNLHDTNGDELCELVMVNGDVIKLTKPQFDNLNIK